jgi:hypothetical protein
LFSQQVFSSVIGTSDVTRVLNRVDQGDPEAAAELLPLVYNELRRLAASGDRMELANGVAADLAAANDACLRGRWLPLMAPAAAATRIGTQGTKRRTGHRSPFCL